MKCLLFVLAACGSSGPPSAVKPTPQPPPPPAPPALTTIVGIWGGMGWQPDAASPIEIHMTIDRSAPVGDVVGHIDYTRVGCIADLVRLASPPTELRVKERMTTNPNDACVDGGTIVIPITPTEDTLDFKWLYPDGKVGVTATLAR